MRPISAIWWSGRGADGYLVRLGEVSTVSLAAENERSGAAVDGGPAIMMMITPLSTANVLEVASATKTALARIQQTLPEDISLEVNIDNSVFILESMKKVLLALSETMVIVLVVIFIFLGSMRATLIPAATIPVSIFAATMVMAVLGYSINTLTLLGAVLAIGLVVDDAIVVLENIVRRIEEGEPAAACGDQRQQGNLLRGRGHHHGAGCGVPADLLSARQHRPPVQRIRRDRGCRRGVFGTRGADADADDDVQAVFEGHPSGPARDAHGQRIQGHQHQLHRRACAGRCRDGGRWRSCRSPASPRWPRSCC